MASETTRSNESGFSLVELLIAMAITAGMSAVVFNLFLQNQNIFQDQNLIIEMQQSARAIASMMADEIRRASQGVPAYASSMDTSSPDDSVQVFLTGTDADTIVFRSGIDNGIARVTTATPMTFTNGTQATISLDDVSAIDDIVGNETDRFLYLWGELDITWTWVRAQIDSIDTVSDTITITPDDIAAGGGTFPATPNIFAEQVLVYRLDSGNIQRGEAGDMTDQLDPDLTYTSVGNNFTGLSFTYYDADGNVVTIADLDDRASVRRVDFTLRAETSQALPSTGNMGTFEVTLTVFPRNVMLY